MPPGQIRVLTVKVTCAPPAQTIELLQRRHVGRIVRANGDYEMANFNEIYRGDLCDVHNILETEQLTPEELQAAVTNLTKCVLDLQKQLIDAQTELQRSRPSIAAAGNLIPIGCYAP